jgi:hypothetical protein
MVKTPEITGPPESVVTPPVVDPRMAVNPEQPDTAQSPREGPAPTPPAPAR